MKWVSEQSTGPLWIYGAGEYCSFCLRVTEVLTISCSWHRQKYPCVSSIYTEISDSILLKISRSMVIDHFSQDSNQKNDAVAYVYIKGEDTTLRNSPDRIVSMLIKQLCWKLETLPDQTLDYYRQCKKDARLPVLNKLAATFMECAGSLGRTVVVIDGLDECEEKCRKPILDFVAATSQQVNSKFLITSRWEWDIERAFSRIKSLLIPGITSDQKDIAKVVKYRVEKELRHFSSDTQEYIIQQLVEKSNGM